MCRQRSNVLTIMLSPESTLPNCAVELQQGHIDTSECAKLSKKRSKIDSPDTKLLGTARNTMSLERNPGVMNTENMIVFI